MDEKEQLLRILNSLVRAIKDDILAEESAVTLYEDHIKDFCQMFKLYESPDWIKKVLKDEEISSEIVNKIYDIIETTITGSGKQGFKIIPSILHIKDEEVEHIKEFKKMLIGIEKIITFLSYS